MVAFMRKRVDRHGMVGPYGVRYSWVYWALTTATFAWLIVDIFDDGAIWNYGVILCISNGRQLRAINRPPSGVSTRPQPVLTPYKQERARSNRATGSDS
jgi:hypothetical protein